MSCPARATGARGAESEDASGKVCASIAAPQSVPVAAAHPARLLIQLSPRGPGAGIPPPQCGLAPSVRLSLSGNGLGSLGGSPNKWGVGPETRARLLEPEAPRGPPASRPILPSNHTAPCTYRHSVGLWSKPSANCRAHTPLELVLCHCRPAVPTNTRGTDRAPQALVGCAMTPTWKTRD